MQSQQKSLQMVTSMVMVRTTVLMETKMEITQWVITTQDTVVN
jgi:hypothetical protein